MKNETSSRDYTRSDFVRAGVVAAVWAVLYVLLATHSGGHAALTERMATAAAPALVAEDAVATRDVAHRSERGRSGR